MEKHIIFLYRFCNKLYYKDYNNKVTKLFINKLIVKPIYSYYRTLLSVFYGACFPYKAKIGKNLKLNHSFYGIFISSRAVIGDNCTIVQHSTIGSNEPVSSDAPVIGNNVFIGANSNITGKTSIGDNCKIGAGTTIANSNIADNSVVVGQKFRIIKPQH